MHAQPSAQMNQCKIPHNLEQPVAIDEAGGIVQIDKLPREMRYCGEFQAPSVFYA